MRGLRMTSKLHDQFRSLFPVIVRLYVPTLAVLGVAVILSVKADVPISYLTRDPVAIPDRHPFFGLLSNIGVLLWAVCAGVCVFASAVLRARAVKEGWPAFFLFAGLITAVLLIDDFFLLHEWIFPAHLGIDERFTLPLYGVIVLVHLAWFRRLIQRTEYLLLLFAFGLFGLSVIVDQWPKPMQSWLFLLEDGFKLFGIVSWFGYFVTSAYRAATCANEAEPRNRVGAP
jgi:hypothetical protein